MSQKLDAPLSTDQGKDAKTPTKHTGSENVCYGYPIDSDSESESDSREQRILRDQTAEGLARIVQRFWAKVDQSGECWLWTASVMGRYGHGQFVVKDAHSGRYHHLYAHRVAWAIDGRSIPPNLKLCHSCDVALCVRPSHLFIGTQQDNLNDARAKYRLVDGLGARKLSDDAYREILSSSVYGHGVEMAKKYGVSVVSISRIKHGRQGTTFHDSHRVLSQPAGVVPSFD